MRLCSRLTNFSTSRSSPSGPPTPVKGGEAACEALEGRRCPNRMGLVTLVRKRRSRHLVPASYFPYQGYLDGVGRIARLRHGRRNTVPNSRHGGKHVYLYSSVDYVSLKLDACSARDLGGPDGLWVRVLGVLGTREGASRVSPMRVGPFSGYQTKGAFLGFNADGEALVRVPGASADRAVVKDAFPQGIPTRLDLQSTYRVGGVSRETVLAAYEDFRSARDGRGRGKPACYGLIISDGATATSGKRSRQGIYLRVYEAGVKHKDVPELEGTVRYEAELTGWWAKRAFAVLKPEFKQEDIHQIVVMHFKSRGLHLCKDASDGRLRLLLNKADAERNAGHWDTLQWFERQVAPSVRRMIALNGADVLPRIIEALSLASYVSIADTRCSQNLE